MAGLTINIDTTTAQRASNNLRRSLTTLGHSAVSNEQEFERLERRLQRQLGADIARRNIDALRQSLHLTRMETIQLQISTGNYRQALITAVGSVFNAQNAFIALGVAITGTGIALKGLSSYSDINKAMIAVQKTTGLTDKEAKKLTASFEKMSMRLPVATKNLLGIAEAAGQLGVQGAKNILAFTETIARLEMSTDIAGEEGAKQIKRLLNVTGEGVETIATFGAVIAKLGGSAAATEQEILSLATEMGAATTTFAVSSAEILALSAAMKEAGASAELGGSVVRKAFSSINKAILYGGEQFQLLQNITKMTGDQLKKTFKTDAMDVFRAWLAGMNEMALQSGDVEGELRKFGLAGDEVNKVLPPLMKNTKALIKHFGTMERELKNPLALIKESAKASTSFWAQMEMSWNAVDVIMSKVGEGLSESIIKIALSFRTWVEHNDAFLKQDVPEHISNIAEELRNYGVAIKNIVNSPEFKFLREHWKLLAAGAIGFKIGGVKGAVGFAGAEAWREVYGELADGMKAYNDEVDRASKPFSNDIGFDKKMSLEDFRGAFGLPDKSVSEDIKKGETQLQKKGSSEEALPVIDTSAQTEAYIKLYNEMGVVSDEAYSGLKEKYAYDRDAFFLATNNKALANEVYASRVAELNEEMYGKINLQDKAHWVDMMATTAENRAEKERLWDEAWAEQEAKENLAYEERLIALEEFNEQYDMLGKSRLDLERENLDASVKQWEEYGFSKERVTAIYEDKNKILDDKDKKVKEAKKKREYQDVQSTVGMMGDGFAMIADMQGKHSKEAFAISKAMKAVEIGMATYTMAVNAYASMLTLGPVGVVLAPIAAAAAVAFGMAQLAALNAQQPPSFDDGGISRAGGIYQTGNIDEAHVPLKSGKIPVEIKSSAPQMNVNIYEAEGTTVTVNQSDDGLSMDIIVEKIEQSLTNRMNNGGGMSNFLNSKYARVF